MFLILSEIATGGSWICYFKALQIGDVNKVTPIDKLSILVTIGFSRGKLKEKLCKKAFIGLVGTVLGTLFYCVKCHINH